MRFFFTESDTVLIACTASLPFKKKFEEKVTEICVWQSYLIRVEIFCNNITSGTCRNNAVNSFMHRSLFTPTVNFNDMLQCSL